MARRVRIAGIGVILLERSDRARHVSISVRPFKGVRVAVPRGVSFKAAESFARLKKDWIARQIRQADRLEAEHAAFQRESGFPMAPPAAIKLLADRLEQLAERHGFSYHRVSVRCQKTRWGSCSTRDNISLNINLVRLPEDLMDYIILHELMHTRIKDHSSRFWGELEKIVGNVKAFNDRMKQYSAMLL